MVAEAVQLFAEGEMSRCQGSGLQPEHGAARGKEALPLPPAPTPSARLRDWGDTKGTESGGFTMSLEQPTPPPGKHCAGGK